MMGVFKFIYGGGIVFTLGSMFYRNTAGGHRLNEKNRSTSTCLPAEAEPTLNSSSCYPLVNFTRPFCENFGITLPKYLYMTPENQSLRNHYANDVYEKVVRLGLAKASKIFRMDIAALRRCDHIYRLAIVCHHFFARCDGTQSAYKEQKICRETCLTARRICYKLWKPVETIIIRKNPELRIKKLLHCELQPYRNAGDSPECWYDDFTNFTGESLPPEWKTSADCLYLNGSSYHGIISVTKSGIPCQSWTEQCPHRHTMNTTYPELNKAENYCRNPKNSGQRPWCFTTDRNKRWEYCDIPKCRPVDGSYGNWTLKNACNVTCGEGFETWIRDCNNPEPKFNGRNCSHLGDSVEYRTCLARPCPVSGGYSNWSVGIPCNVSCGEGVEVWQRTCDNPEPKYGGHNCSELGDSFELRKCKREPCPIDGNYSNWIKASPCSVTCDGGVEIWIRNCDSPPGKYGGNCSKLGPNQENRPCKNQPCPVDSDTIGVIVAVASFAVIAAVAILIFFLRKRWCKKQESPQYYAIFRFASQHSPRRQQDNNQEDCASSSGEDDTSAEYGNLTTEGNPISGLSRGVVPYRRDYMNTRPSRSSLYDRLQVFRSIAVEWLRNAWGNVDELGHHVYDVMQQNVRQNFVPYDRLGIAGQNIASGSANPTCDTLENSALDDSTETGKETISSTYDTLERSLAVVLPSRPENALKTKLT